MTEGKGTSFNALFITQLTRYKSSCVLPKARLSSLFIGEMYNQMIALAFC